MRSTDHQKLPFGSLSCSRMRILGSLPNNIRKCTFKLILQKRYSHTDILKELLYDISDSQKFIPSASPIASNLLRVSSYGKLSSLFIEYSKARSKKEFDQLRTSDFQSILRSVVCPKNGKNIRHRDRDLVSLQIKLILQDADRLGIQFNIVDYTHILRVAMYTGNKHILEYIVARVKEKRIRPSVDYFNAILGVIGGNRWSLSKFQSPAFRGSPVTEPVSGKMLDMIEVDFPNYDLVPNSTTYDYLMVGLSRDGKIREIYDLIDTVWGINENSSSKKVDCGNVTFPTHHTVFSIISALGYLGDVSSAVSLSRKLTSVYKINFPELAWRYIIYWSIASLQFRAPAGHARIKNIELFIRLYSQMYRHCVPIIEIYDTSIKFYMKHGRFGLLEKVCESWTKQFLGSLEKQNNEVKKKHLQLLEKQISKLMRYAETERPHDTKRVSVKWSNVLNQIHSSVGDPAKP